MPDDSSVSQPAPLENNAPSSAEAPPVTLDYGRTRAGNELKASRLQDVQFHGFCAGVVVAGILLFPFAHLGYIQQKTQAQLVCVGVAECLLMRLFQFVLRSTSPPRLPRGHLWFSVAGGFLNSLAILATLYIATTYVAWCDPQTSFKTAALAAIGEIACYTLATTILLQPATRERLLY